MTFYIVKEKSFDDSSPTKLLVLRIRDIFYAHSNVKKNINHNRINASGSLVCSVVLENVICV